MRVNCSEILLAKPYQAEHEWIPPAEGELGNMYYEWMEEGWRETEREHRVREKTIYRMGGKGKKGL